MTSNDDNKVVVAYITYGRDEYDYNTIFVGVFKSHEKATKAIFSRLVVERMILDVDTLTDTYDDNDIDHLLTIFKDEESYHEYISGTHGDSFPFHLLNPDADLETIIKENNDSYYKDGWDYTIKNTLIII